MRGDHRKEYDSKEVGLLLHNITTYNSNVRFIWTYQSVDYILARINLVTLAVNSSRSTNG